MANAENADFDLILQDLLHDETDQNSITDLVNFRNDLMNQGSSRSTQNSQRDIVNDLPGISEENLASDNADVSILADILVQMNDINVTQENASTNTVLTEQSQGNQSVSGEILNNIVHEGHEIRSSASVTQNQSVVGTERRTGYFCNDMVFNLSNRVLTDTEISLLSKGLSFCPTPKYIDQDELEAAFG